MASRTNLSYPLEGVNKLGGSKLTVAHNGTLPESLRPFYPSLCRKLCIEFWSFKCIYSLGWNYATLTILIFLILFK